MGLSRACSAFVGEPLQSCDEADRLSPVALKAGGAAAWVQEPRHA